MIYVALGIGFTSAAILLYFWLQRKGQSGNQSGVGIEIVVYSLNRSEVQTLIQSFTLVAQQHNASILKETGVEESHIGTECFESILQIGNLTKPATEALSHHELPEKTFAVLSMIIDGEVQAENRNRLEKCLFRAKLWNHIGHAGNAQNCIDQARELGFEGTLEDLECSD